MPLTAWRVADDTCRDTGRLAAIARSTAIELSEDNRVVRSRDVVIVVDANDDDDDFHVNSETQISSPTTPDAVKNIRRAFNDRVVDSPFTSTSLATHVGLHGGSPAARITTDASGNRIFALQRDGAVALWRREDRKSVV